MDSKNLKAIFDKIAIANNFDQAFGGWVKESSECLIILDLQKSNFGNYYDLNIKIFVQGLFGNSYVKGKDLVKKMTGDIFLRQPISYNDAFDYDNSISEAKRKEQLQGLFHEFIVPWTDKALSRTGLKELAQSNVLYLLPAVKEELN